MRKDNGYQYQDDIDLRIILQGFQSSHDKMLQNEHFSVRLTHTGNKGKKESLRNRKSQQRNRRHKEEPNGNFKLKNIITEIFKESMEGLNSKIVSRERNGQIQRQKLL